MFTECDRLWNRPGLLGGLAVCSLAAAQSGSGSVEPTVVECSPGLAGTLTSASLTDLGPDVSYVFTGLFRPELLTQCDIGTGCEPCPDIDRLDLEIDVFEDISNVLVASGSTTVPGSQITNRALNQTPTDVTITPDQPLAEGDYYALGRFILTLSDGTTVTAFDELPVVVSPDVSGRMTVEQVLSDLTSLQAQPGSVQTNTYRVTNNDPLLPMNVEFRATNDQNARLAMIDEAPGTAPMFERSFEDPISGYPFAISADNPCIPYLRDPRVAGPQETHSIFSVPPSSSTDILIFSRSHPQARTGSVCNQIVDIHAEWGDQQEVRRVLASLTEADWTVKAALDCPDSGGQMPTFIISPSTLGLDTPIGYTPFFGLDIVGGPGAVAVDGVPVPSSVTTALGGRFGFTSDSGRLIYTADLPPTPSGGVITGSFPISIFGFQADILSSTYEDLPDVPSAPFNERTPAGQLFLGVLDDVSMGQGVPDITAAIGPTIRFEAASLDSFGGVIIGGNGTSLFENLDLNVDWNEGGGSAGGTVSFQADMPEYNGPTRLAFSIIMRTALTRVPEDPGCNEADIAEPFGVLDLNDVSAFAGGFLSQDPIADVTGDGLFDLDDIGLFIDAFIAGCP